MPGYLTGSSREFAPGNEAELRVFIQNIWPAPDQALIIGADLVDYYAGVQRLLAGIFGPDAEMRLHHNAHSSHHVTCEFMSYYNNVGMIEGLLGAEREGYDVALVLCGNDPAVHGAREALRIPVVGMTESAMLTACTLGRRFGIVCMEEESLVLVEQNLERYRLEDRAISRRPVRSMDCHEDFSRWFRDPQYVRDSIIPRFEAVARSLIDDGAEVIVTACAAFSALTLSGYARISGTEVPVIEAVHAAGHMARTLGTMYRRYGISTSKQHTFKGIAPDLVKQFLPSSASP